MAVPPRDPAIDCLKGLAILAVIGIHAEVLAGSRVMVHGINHAVPVFVVLFGLNAEQWWQRHGEPAATLWWADRLWRLYPPLWATMALWWGMTLAASPWWLQASWTTVVLNLGGMLPNIGTGWFVTVILQLIALQPLLHRLARRAGIGWVLALGLTCLVVTVVLRPWLVGWLGVRGARMFAPRLLGHVAFGMALARWLPVLDGRVVLVAVAAVVVCAGLHERASSPVVAGLAERLLDLPLTVALLVACRSLGSWPVVTRPLVWLGVHSYGVYLGQLLVHDGAALAFGLRAAVGRVGPWPYAAMLLAGAVALVVGGTAARSLAARSLRRGPRPTALGVHGGRFANPDAGR